MCCPTVFRRLWWGRHGERGFRYPGGGGAQLPWARRPAAYADLGQCHHGGTALPGHPYTQVMLSAVPIPDPEVERGRRRIPIRGTVPSPINPPSGCYFHDRCPRAEALAKTLSASELSQSKSGSLVPRLCAETYPAMQRPAGGNIQACHFPILRGKRARSSFRQGKPICEHSLHRAPGRGRLRALRRQRRRFLTTTRLPRR